MSTNNDIALKILHLALEKAKQGGELCLEDLSSQFSEHEIDVSVEYLTTRQLVTHDYTDLSDEWGYLKMTSKGYDFVEKQTKNSHWLLSIFTNPERRAIFLAIIAVIGIILTFLNFLKN